MKTHQDFLEIACDAAQIGATTLETSHPDAVHHKGDRDLVTDIDLAIQRDIDDYLRKTTPDIPLLAEESVELPDINTAEWLWVLDPIDGTEFVETLQGGWTLLAVYDPSRLAPVTVRKRDLQSSGRGDAVTITGSAAAGKPHAGG